MKDAKEDWTRPGDTLVEVKWHERQEVLQLLDRDQELMALLSKSAIVGSHRPEFFNLVVDASKTMGTRAHIWKPNAQAPIFTNVALQRSLGERVLAIVTTVILLRNGF
jgi:hypothetical protein